MSPKTQFVYLIGSSESPLVKIGTTNDLTARLRGIQNMSPAPLQVLWRIEGDRSLEAALHEHFREYRQHGEWFDFKSLDAAQLVNAAAETLRSRTVTQAVERALKESAYDPDQVLGSTEAISLVWDSTVDDPEERLLLLALADSAGTDLIWASDVHIQAKTRMSADVLATVFDRLVATGLVCPAGVPHPAEPSIRSYVLNVRRLRRMRQKPTADAAPAKNPFQTAKGGPMAGDPA